MLLDQIRRQPLLQLILSLVVLLIAGLVYIKSSASETILVSPFIQLQELEWLKPLMAALNFIILFGSLFQLSTLLRNFKFASDTRFEMLSLMAAYLLLYPSLLFHTELILTIFFLQRALALQFQIHTQLNVKGELAWMAFYMALASFFYPICILITILLYIGILLQRGFFIRELIIYLIVFSLPYYFFLSVFYIADLPLQVDLQFDYSSLELGKMNLLKLLQFCFAIFVFLFLIRSYSLTNKEVLRAKAQFRNFYLLLLFGFIWYLLMDPIEGAAISLLPIFAIFAQSYSSVSKKWIVDTALSIIILLGVVNYLLAF